MKKLLIITVMFMLPIGLFGQIEYLIDDTYIVSGGAYTQVTVLTAGNWDDGYVDLILPAANQFYFYGKKVTHVRMWTNGYVTFGFGAAPTDYSDFSPDPIPHTDNPNSYAAPWWQDWDLTTTGEMWYEFGTNYTVCKWNGVPHNGDATSAYTFWVAFFNRNYSNIPLLASNTILFGYPVKASGIGTYDNGSGATIGVEHYTGTNAAVYSEPSASPLSGDNILFVPHVPVYESTDIFAGGDVDLMIYRPSQGLWAYRDGDTGSTGRLHFGGAYDTPLPGDMDGDGNADPLLFRPSQGRWRGISPNIDTYWGTHGDIPVPADYNDDGKTDIAIFRPYTGQWRINYTDGGSATFYFGQTGDIPVPGDYDGDGQIEVAIVRPGDYLQWRAAYSGGGGLNQFYGIEGDVPMPGTWEGALDITQIGIFRDSDGSWRTPQTGINHWGMSGDLPVANDYNQGGLTDWVIFRPSTGMWRILFNVGGSPSGNGTEYWGGTPGDIPRARRSSAVRASNDQK